MWRAKGPPRQETQKASSPCTSFPRDGPGPALATTVKGPILEAMGVDSLTGEALPRARDPYFHIDKRFLGENPPTW
ncbi:MAG: hypothetical protein CM15mP128_3990 [Methanobacteriota archaeon]|nr:MAG: hypothetical protein CM15mP128_3990 [Euryarchaeota archaeon]